MACTKTTTRAAPVTAWAQQGVGVTQIDSGLRDVLMWARAERQHATNLNFIGGGIDANANNGSGSPAYTVGWNAALKRYAAKMTQAGATVNQQGLGIGFSPGVLVDPLFPITPILLRYRDVIQVNRDAGATYGTAAFLVGHGYPFQQGNIESIRSIGFHSYGSGNWQTYHGSRQAATKLHGVDTGKLIGTMAELMFEIDGLNKEIRWYVDGALVDKYTPAVDGGVNLTAGVNTFASLWWEIRPDAGVTFSMYSGMGIGPLCEIERLA